MKANQPLLSWRWLRCCFFVYASCISQRALRTATAFSTPSQATSPIRTAAHSTTNASIERMLLTSSPCLYAAHVALRAQSSDEDNADQKPGTARFTGIETSRQADGATNLLDTVLSFVASDIVSIVIGLVGLLVIVGNRLSHLDDLAVPATTATMSASARLAASESSKALAQQTRTDLLAVFACGSILLNGITKLDVTSALSETVVLEGIRLEAPQLNLPAIQSQRLGIAEDSDVVIADIEKEWTWAMRALLSATPARTAVILQGCPKPISADGQTPSWQVVACSGTVPKASSGRSLTNNAPILDRVGSQLKSETYLPTLQALPGRFEFTYMPDNSQLALLIPVDLCVGSSRSKDTVSTVLVLGSDTAKSFTPKDVAWARVIAERMGKVL